jgi:hypothetical protein
MSIRQSPQLTPQLLDAARSNARHSTGPRTQAGKHHSRMNALEHGERSDPENHYAVMRALGEDPAQFDALKRELRASFSTGDPFVEKQVDDLAYLYSRRDRLERMEGGLVRRALLELEEKQHRRRKEIEDCTIEVGQAINVTLEAPSDPAARLRLLLSFLALIRLQVHGRHFLAWQAAALQGFYRDKTGWRGPRLCFLLALFAGSNLPLPLGNAGAHVADAEDDEDADVEAPLGGAEADEPASPAPATEPADELRYNELVLLLADEVAAVEQEFEYEEKLNEEKTAIERDACLAPAGEEWRMLLRREESLDRAIDRKIKLLMTLRKAATQKPQTLESRSGPAELGAPAEDAGATARTAELRSAPAEDVGSPAPIDEEPSPEGSPMSGPIRIGPSDPRDRGGCQAPAVSSAGA